MIKLFILAVTVALTTLCSSSIITEDNCVLIDFTAEEAEFEDLNAGIKTAKFDKLLGSMLGKYDPFNRSNIPLRFNFNRFLTISTAIDTISISGATGFVPQHINVTSPNSVSIETVSYGEIVVDVNLNAKVEAMGLPAQAQLRFVLEQPTVIVEVEANMYACEPGAPASVCTNLTVADLQNHLENATTKEPFANTIKKVLKRIKDASVKSFSLSYQSMSNFKLSFDSSSFVFRTLLHLIPDYEADDFNTEGIIKTGYLKIMSRHAPKLLNYFIKDMLEPSFGATCLTEE
ncbi:hypothetical protein PPTG_03744 [Phytophthora nicotianae INRA-310]|uniref:Lipid-binding serum glycoprotein N-terminal domain-containing protein n=3 Tax=Phytophthora nicotianae TaxID=4792 RepID=W2QXR4_PHYN3|nr:hypothetical protein PPTG_03744 [Phytophthora nicotianae INRA-310]ETL30295.1 hypothetical protein L916_16708 [Phytophthora nicotianae]ETO65356.1 hypothetical protein F444_17304 [Phytophthora nicotianae P1976]KUF91241.1 Ankyrin repeat and FYVE domain-containing protein 1 [Phytophthora nicotianae]ETN18022.1 hypothetical protein PPTG_03744 [Phytophthora nicotianae INRA-310]KUG00599.1 hypothetical protein AM587_10004546 [Phytophthora nicotianae]